MLKGQHYKITVFAGSQGLEPLEDNVDVEVTFDDGSRYRATFFTLENIKEIMDNYLGNEKCMNGSYFWASDMILVRSVSRGNIARVVGHLIGKGEFEGVFARVATPPHESPVTMPSRPTRDCRPDGPRR